MPIFPQYLKDLKTKRVKIIVGEFDEERALEVMCQAYKLNMTAREGYVWFLPTFNFQVRSANTTLQPRLIAKKEISLYRASRLPGTMSTAGSINQVVRWTKRQFPVLQSK